MPEEQQRETQEPPEDIPFQGVDPMPEIDDPTLTYTAGGTAQFIPAADVTRPVNTNDVYLDMMRQIEAANQAARERAEMMRGIPQLTQEEQQRLGQVPVQPILHQRPATTVVPVEPHPDTVGVKLTAEVLLGRSLLDMLRSAPGNATVRTMIGKHCRKTIPPEIKTLEEITQWIEANVTLPPPTVQETARARAQAIAGQVLTQNPDYARLAAAIPAVDREYILTVEVEENGTEEGRATYTANTSQQFTSRWDRREFNTLVESVDDFDELIERIREQSIDDMHNHGDGPETHDVDYSMEETTNSETEETKITNLEHVNQHVVRLLGEMADEIDNDEERDQFRDKFDL